MNWETYKTLTKKQKDEYNYRFNYDISLPNILIPTVIMMCLIVIFTFTAYLIVQNPDLGLSKDDAIQLMTFSFNIVFVTAWWAVIMLIEYVIKLSIKQYSYSKWKKENNIKEIQWYNKWLK